MLTFNDAQNLDLPLVATGDSLANVLSTNGSIIIEATAPPGGPHVDPDMMYSPLPPEWVLWGVYGLGVAALAIVLWKDRD